MSKVDWDCEDHNWFLREGSCHLLDSLCVDIFYSPLVFFDLVWGGGSFDHWSKSSLSNDDWRLIIEESWLFKRLCRIVEKEVKSQVFISIFLMLDSPAFVFLCEVEFEVGTDEMKPCVIGKETCRPASHERVVNKRFFVIREAASDIEHRMRKFCRHHSHLHATSWLFKVCDLVKFDILITKHHSSIMRDSNQLDSLVLDFHIGVQNVGLFESFETVLLFEVDPLVFVRDSEDFFLRKRRKNLIQVSFQKFSSFNDSCKL